MIKKNNETVGLVFLQSNFAIKEKKDCIQVSMSQISMYVYV